MDDINCLIAFFAGMLLATFMIFNEDKSLPPAIRCSQEYRTSVILELQAMGYAQVGQYNASNGVEYITFLGVDWDAYHANRDEYEKKRLINDKSKWVKKRYMVPDDY